MESGRRDAASLLLAKVLRLGDQALETPISAMLILGVSNYDVAAEVRILNTLIGVLASGLDTLEHCLLSIRALFVVLLAEVPSEQEPDDPYGAELRSAFAVVLHDAADCLRAFGGLVIAEAEDREEETEQALAESLEILRETQAILTELIMVNAEDDRAAWLLRGSILAAVEHVLSRLDLEDRARVRQPWKEGTTATIAGLPAPDDPGRSPPPERPYPRGFQPDKVFGRPRGDGGQEFPDPPAEGVNPPTP